MAINPVFRGYVKWYGEEDSPQNSESDIREWLLERLPFEVVEPFSVADLRDIGNSVEGKWSSYASRWDNGSYYFFETETDAMAFKLTWT